MGDNVYLGDRNGVPHAHAVERRTAMPASPSQPPEALPADHHRPRVPLRDGQRRGFGKDPRPRCCGGCARMLAPAQALPGLRPGDGWEFSATQRTGRCFALPACATASRAVADSRPTCRASPSSWSWTCRASRAPSRWSLSPGDPLPGHRRPALPADLGPHAVYWLAIEGPRGGRRSRR